jgi:glycosyltransferase involved in cell wall biosynthesis
MTLADSPVFRHGISPNKLFDYFAAARPVIFAVNTPTNPVQEAGAGLTIGAGRPEELADAIRTLRELPLKERQEMGLRGRRHVEEHHDLGRLADRFEGVMLEAARGKRGG